MRLQAMHQVRNGFGRLLLLALGWNCGSDASAAPKAMQPSERVRPTFAVPASIDANGSADVTDALTDFFSRVPDGSTIEFPKGAIYRVEGTLLFANRHDLMIEGHGATIVARTDGSGVAPPTGLKPGWPRHRAHVMFVGGSNITVRRLTVIGANPNAGLSDLAYVTALEAQHAFEFKGVRGVLVDSVRATDVYGDFVTLGQNPWSTDVVIRDSYFDRSGRQGIAITGARNVLIERNYIGNVRRTSIDIEPNTSAGGAQHVTIRHNTFGPAVHNLLSAHGAAGFMDDITIESNTLINHAIKVDVKPPEGSRRSRFRILNNTSDRGFGSPLSLMKFTRIDSVEVRGNYQRLAPNQPTVGVRTVESCYVTVTGNQFINTPREADIQATACR